MTTHKKAAQDESARWGIVLLQGIAAIVIGFLLLTNPAATTEAVVQLLGIYLLISGMLSFVRIFTEGTGFGLKLIGGVLGVFGGIYIIRHPLWSALFVPGLAVVTLSIAAMFMGLVHLVEGFQRRSWGIVILGVVSFLLGLYLLLNPLGATIVLPLALGVVGIVGGIVAVVQAFRMR